MIGILDVGGGMRGAYTAGIYEYLLDREIQLEYCLGISAGAANMVSYLANQRGRNLIFYSEYAFRKAYASVRNLIFRGSLFDFDYIYSTLCNRGGENPVDYETFSQSAARYTVAATIAETGDIHFFTKSDIQQDNYEILKASCCLPIVCRPIKIKGVWYFDGGIANPIPYRKAFEDGCEKLIVVLTRPVDTRRTKQRDLSFLKGTLLRYPKIHDRLSNRHIVYNQAVEELKVLEKEGLVKIIAPVSTCGVTTMKKDRVGIQRLYELGYEDGKKIEAFLVQSRSDMRAV